MNNDVVALGELLMDCTINEELNNGNHTFTANPGGAPCNVLAMLNKLGRKTAFIGKVGNDIFGKELKEVIESVGINSSNLILDDNFKTTLAFVSKDKNRDREFSFYRKNGADENIRRDEINEDLIKNSMIFHFGTLSFTNEVCSGATKHAIDIAKENGLVVTFDPNLREKLWDNLDDARESFEYGFSKCDVLKISDNEVEWYTGKTDLVEGVKEIRAKFPNIKLLTLTMGCNGAVAFYDDLVVECPAFIQKGSVETTGCGDTFCGNLINGVLDYGIDNFNEDRLFRTLFRANAAASIVSKRIGALKVMPTDEEIDDFIYSLDYGLSTYPLNKFDSYQYKK